MNERSTSGTATISARNTTIIIDTFVAGVTKCVSNVGYCDDSAVCPSVCYTCTPFIEATAAR